MTPDVELDRDSSEQRPTDAVRDLVHRSFRLMEVWDDEEAARLIHPESVNHEAVAEPPAARGRGPQAYRATYDWLHGAYADVRWTVHDVVAEGDLAVARVTMTGRHVGPFTVFSPDGVLDQVFAPTGRTFEVTQMHMYRLRDGAIADHWANRDDLGQARQLGWVPPTPAFLLRGALLKRRLRRG